MKTDILLVDDRPDGLLAMEAVLRSPDYNLVMAGSGHEALAALYAHDFAVILLDVQMPVMDGFETAQLIREYEPARETPIIFVTAINKDSHHISRGYESGAIDYLFKPIDPHILKSKVRVFVDLCQARQALKKNNEELERRVEERTAELLQSNKELEQFNYIASHDLQEPLRKIAIYSERLKENSAEDLNEPARDYLERIHRAGARMKTVIDDLLAFSKIGAARESTFEQIDLHETLQEVLTDLEMKIQQEKAEIEIADMPRIVGNRPQIRHLFQNLILNSIKFSKKGEKPHVLIRSEKNHRFADIHVQDNGIGFDEKYAERIFKPFQRLHSRQEYEGSGIGLSICQKIVTQHGGRISAHSTPGEGATFTVQLPLVAQE